MQSIPTTPSSSVTAESFFLAKSEEQIAIWLRVGFETYLSEQGNFDLFFPLQRFFNIDVPVSEGIAVLCSELKPREQSKLRSALAISLDSLPVSLQTAATIKEILYCARRLPAPEIFSPLLKKLRGMRESQGPYFEASDKDVGGRTLFEVTFQIAVDMPVAAALPVLKELIATRHFDLSHFGLALDSLCRIDPDNFITHFNQMRENLSAMFASYNTPPRIKRLLAKRIITSVGLERFRTQHDSLRFEASSTRATDNWFYMCLFKGENPILLLRHGRIAWADQERKVWYNLERTIKPVGIPEIAAIAAQGTHLYEDADPMIILHEMRMRLGAREMSLID